MSAMSFWDGEKPYCPRRIAASHLLIDEPLRKFRKSGILDDAQHRARRSVNRYGIDRHLPRHRVRSSQHLSRSDEHAVSLTREIGECRKLRGGNPILRVADVVSNHHRARRNWNKEKKDDEKPLHVVQ